MTVSPRVERWRRHTLEFLSLRAPAMATDWSPRVARELVESLAQGDWELVIALNAFSSPASMRYFANLPRLIERELTADWSRREVTTLGRAKGVVDPRRTAIARAQMNAAQVLVYRKLERAWETDENQALAGFLMYAERSVRLGLRAMRSRAAWQEPILASLRQLRTALRTFPLRSVEPDSAWAAYVLQPREHRRSPLYSGFYKIARAWARSRTALDGEELRSTLGGGWLIPGTDDAVFETYLASNVVEALHASRDWAVFRLAPIGLSARIAEAQAQDLLATISFDASPARALGRGVPGDYRWIYDVYDDLDLSARRPDVTLHLQGSREVVVLFEAKATEVNSDYGRDSIYKCLGYLKDFSSVWGDETPRVVACFAGGVESGVSLASRMDRDLLLTSDPSLASDVRAVVGRALALAS